MISFYLFKRVSYDLGVSPLSRKVVQVLQALFSTLITVSYIKKAMQVAFYAYLSLKSHLSMTIPIYDMICQSDTYMGT